MYIAADIPFWKPVDFLGKPEDFRLLQEDAWLMNTEVKYQLFKKNGLWHLIMIYVAVENPLKFICILEPDWFAISVANQFCFSIEKLTSIIPRKRLKPLLLFCSAGFERMPEEL